MQQGGLCTTACRICKTASLFCNEAELTAAFVLVAAKDHHTISAASLFGQRQGAWDIVWRRFEEAPHAYPHLPDLLRRARPEQMSLFSHIESWPQDNEDAENALRERLLAQRERFPQDVRLTIHTLGISPDPGVSARR